MGEIINLRRVKKKRARDAAAETAAASRARHGRTRAERTREEVEEHRLARVLDQARIEDAAAAKPGGENPTAR
jgi:hypothetical protein